MKIRIVTPVNANAEAWSAALRRVDRSFEVAVDLHAIHATNVLINGSRPDLVIAESATSKDFEAFETLANAHPELDYLLVTSDLTSNALMRAMRAGAREVLPAPASADDLVEAARRIARKLTPTSAAPMKHGEVLGFMSCKGGSGATFVAANVAQMLARNGERRVALLDLNLQFGDAALFVTNEKLASNVAEVSRNIRRLDRDFLQAAMTPAGPGLWVLPAPEDPSQSTDVTPETVQALLAVASTMFDYVVIDAGRSINAVSLRALDACQRIYVVLQLTLPFIRDARRLMDVFRSLDYHGNKVRWIVNRHEKGGEISIDDLKRTLNVQEMMTLPNQYAVVASSVNQGIPVDRLAPHSAIAKALRDLAEAIAPAPVAARSSRWLGGLLRGGGE